MPRQGQKSKDPVQQHLRDHKHTWSKNTSEFISKIIAFKRGLNGRGDAQAGIQPSSIKEQLPSEVGSLLDQLASQFQSIVQDAGSIIDEQANYSKTRRKKRPKQAPSTPTVDSSNNTITAPSNGVVDTLSRLGSSNLEKDATSRLSRMWEYVKAPFSRKEYNKHRIGMLSLAADLYYNFLDFENDILSLSINTIPAAVKKYQMARYSYDELGATLANLIEIIARNSNKEQMVDKGQKTVDEQSKQEELQPNSAQDKKVKDIETNMHILYNTGSDQNEILKLNNLITEYENEEDLHMKSMLADRISDNYKRLVNLVKKDKVAYDFINNDIIKVSHTAVSRFLKKQLVKALGYNKTAVHRLQIVEIADDIKKLLKKIMNELQLGLSVENLHKDMSSLEEYMKRIKAPLSILSTMYTETYYSEKKQKQKAGPRKPLDMDKDEFMDFLLRRKVRKDLAKDIF